MIAGWPVNWWVVGGAGARVSFDVLESLGMGDDSGDL